LLQDELPWAHRAVSDRLGGRAVLLEVDGETVWVGSAPGRLELRLRPEPASVVLTTSRAAIGSLIRGDDTLLDAVLCSKVELAGTVDDLVAFDAALMAYLHGAVRCPPFADLCDEYLREPEDDDDREYPEPALYRG
jgi:hypothetical protein